MRMTTMLFVHRTFVGELFPFDKMYFFHKDDEKDIPRIFSDAFVMPISQQLSDAVQDILRESKKRTRESDVSPEYVLQYKARGFNRLSDNEQDAKNASAEKAITRILETRKNYVALVPVLFTKQRPRPKEKDKRKTDQKMIYPQYLTAVKRRKSDDSPGLMRKMMGTRAYFVYQSEVFRPLCLLCPLSIDSVVGDCKFGSKDCYFNLGHIGESDFTRGVKAYRKLAKQIDEPELGLKEAPDA